MSNPAARLHKILTNLDQKNHSLPMLQGWRNCLQVQPEVSAIVLITKIGKVFTIPLTVEILVNRFSDLKPDLYLSWVSRLTNIFQTINFQSQFIEFSQRIDDKILIPLAFCSEALEIRLPEKEISKEALQEIKESASNLYQEILASDISPELSQYLLDNVYSIITAIDDYFIMGSAAIEHAFASSIGSVIVNPKSAKEASISDQGKRFWEILGKIGLILQISKTAAELPDAFHNLLHLTK